jgi:hypothetical protein
LSRSRSPLDYRPPICWHATNPAMGGRRKLRAPENADRNSSPAACRHLHRGRNGRGPAGRDAEAGGAHRLTWPPGRRPRSGRHLPPKAIERSAQERGDLRGLRPRIRHRRPFRGKPIDARHDPANTRQGISRKDLRSGRSKLSVFLFGSVLGANGLDSFSGERVIPAIAPSRDGSLHARQFHLRITALEREFPDFDPRT